MLPAVTLYINTKQHFLLTVKGESCVSGNPEVSHRFTQDLKLKKDNTVQSVHLQTKVTKEKKVTKAAQCATLTALVSTG